MKVNTKSQKLNLLIHRTCESVEQKGNNSKLYRGSLLNIDIYGEIGRWWKELQKAGITETIEGGDNYSQAYGSSELLTIASYCEGDLTFTVHDTLEDYF